ncbi:hypothetical protein [Luteococcus sp.]|uniref:hypothetical protein n=1 Tax=Luteococcus sp. TaxID=1969402 RepID=UPI0037359BAB
MPLATVPNTHRLTKRSVVIVSLLAALFTAEMFGVVRKQTAETISNVEWWLAGDRFALRWWVVTAEIGALMLWAWLHFAFGGDVWGPRQLVAMLASFLVVSLLLMVAFR